MYQIGKGFSKQGTVLVGAAGGAGYQTRPRELNAPRWEVTVRMDAGGTRSVTQNYEPMLREGDRVRVLGTQLELLQ
jgi:outer membrane lipoprotein SlyB